MFDQIPASSEMLVERPRIRRRVIVALAIFVIGSALLHVSFGSSVAAMSAHWRNAGPPDQDAVTVITISQSIRDAFMRPTPKPTPPPVIARRTTLHLAQLKYREIGVADSARNHQANLAEHVSLISMQRPERSKPPKSRRFDRTRRHQRPLIPGERRTNSRARSSGATIIRCASCGNLQFLPALPPPRDRRGWKSRSDQTAT
jgi:hypothetical protein